VPGISNAATRNALVSLLKRRGSNRAMAAPGFAELADSLAECRRLLSGAPEAQPTEIDLDLVAARLAEVERAVRAKRSARRPFKRTARSEPRAAGSPAAGLRIAVSLRQFVPTIGGTAIYTRNVLEGLVRDHGARLTVFTVEGQVQTLRETVPDAVFHSVPDHSAGLSIEQDLDADAHDVVFCPLSLLDPPRPSLPAAVTIHGLGHELHPENFDERILELRRRTVRPSARNADVVLTVSEFSKRSIADHCAVDPDKIVIARPGVSPVFAAPAPLEPSAAFRDLRLPDDYLYYAANYWPPKNHANLLRAFHTLLDGRHPTLGLVLSGAPGPDADRVWRLAQDLGLEGHIRMLGFVDQSLVCELARHARVVTHVSQHEGSPIPIAEAFHVGTPVVTTFAAACREVGGDAALYAAYDDPRAIAHEIERLLDDPQLARELSARGRRRAPLFAWDATVAVIADQLNRIARSPRLGTLGG
jgi:glycosyltransferase involved in cell wall biosynthesis